MELQGGRLGRPVRWLRGGTASVSTSGLRLAQATLGRHDQKRALTQAEGGKESPIVPGWREHGGDQSGNTHLWSVYYVPSGGNALMSKTRNSPYLHGSYLPGRADINKIIPRTDGNPQLWQMDGKNQVIMRICKDAIWLGSGQSQQACWESDTMANSQRGSRNNEPPRTVLLKLRAGKTKLFFPLNYYRQTFP